MFKKKHSLTKRKLEAERIRSKYQGRVPVIVEAGSSCIYTLEKHKYLVPADLTIGQFLYTIRNRLVLSADKALFFFINNVIPPTSALMGQLDKENRDEDGFLYLVYNSESTFG